MLRESVSELGCTLRDMNSLTAILTVCSISSMKHLFDDRTPENVYSIVADLISEANQAPEASPRSQAPGRLDGSWNSNGYVYVPGATLPGKVARTLCRVPQQAREGNEAFPCTAVAAHILIEEDLLSGLIHAVYVKIVEDVDLHL